MKLPRDMDAAELIKDLARLGYLADEFNSEVHHLGRPRPSWHADPAPEHGYAPRWVVHFIVEFTAKLFEFKLRRARRLDLTFSVPVFDSD